MTDENISSLDEHNNHGTTNLTCHWNACLKVFPNHASLASHLSEDHVGWKKGGYFCEWTNCTRQGAKCHNRFALMMHLRIHTGEKPFECVLNNCGQTFGRMDALVRHKKAEHGESLDKQPTNSYITHIPNLSPKPRKPTKKTSLDMLSKNKRMRNRMDYTTSSSGGEEEEGEEEEIDETGIIVAPSQTLLSGSPVYTQYRLAKAQLSYILRENEMLQDELEMAQKKLKRMKTERRVLLDAVMATETQQDEDEYELIPNEIV
ncbi:hypothetical protein BDF21DRAFT_333176 [Thamnidium elegans]|nr:hypothetical protein BDF21DRAFT_333176 [Thamnidium elegans]